jgi:sulfotransferase family protein
MRKSNLEPKIVFIVGRGRSGTTLFGSYLNSLPDLCVAPECTFILNLATRYGTRDFKSEDIDAFCADLFRDVRMRNWAFDKAQLSKFIHENVVGETSYSVICRLVYAAQAHFTNKQQAMFVGVKNPHYSLFIKKLALMFPDSRFIHLVRDPRANVASYRRVTFDYSRIGTLASRWSIYNEEILRTTRELGSRYLLIRFEDFIKEIEVVTQSVFQFLDTPDRVLPLRDIIITNEHLKKKPWHQRLNKKIDPSVIDEWRDNLSENQVTIINRICNKYMLLFRYSIEGQSKQSVIRSLVVRLSQFDGQRTVLQERLLFFLPFRIRNLIITLYRRATDTI